MPSEAVMVLRNLRRQAVSLKLLKHRLETFLEVHPNAYVVLNEEDNCLDLYELKNSSGDTEYLAQILME